MSIYVGTPIISVRSRVPDPAPSLPPPAAVVSPGGGGSLLSGNYFVAVTQRNMWGETAYNEYEVTVVAPGSITAVVPYMMPGTIATRAYLTIPGGPAGSEVGYVESTSNTVTITAFPVLAGTPPSQGTAWLPDSSGFRFSAGAMFGWLSQALTKISIAVEGILDYCGVPTQAGNGMYVIPGQWMKITDVWYGGYWIKGGRRADFFRRNSVTSQVLNSVTISVQSDKQVMEVNWQPDRNSGVTQLTAPIGVGDTTAPIANSSAFLLPLGFVQFGSLAGGEICAYDPIAPMALTGLIRGIGNTVAQAWPAGTTVTELSLFWCGRRIFNYLYGPGSSMQTIPCPQPWETFIVDYMLGIAKEADQEMDEGAKLKKRALDDAIAFQMSNKGVPSFVQVGMDNSRVVVYAPTLAGGLIQKF